jgi:hypothetical protein
MAAVTEASFPEAGGTATAVIGAVTSLSAPRAWIIFPTTVMAMIMIIKNPNTTPMPKRDRIPLWPSISIIVILPPQMETKNSNFILPETPPQDQAFALQKPIPKFLTQR